VWGWLPAPRHTGSAIEQHLLRAGIQVLLIGGVSASVGWIIGHDH